MRLSRRTPLVLVMSVTTALMGLLIAGDAFAGAYTCQIAEGASPQQATLWANAAGALATQKEGAQEGIPLRGDVQSLLQKKGHEVQ